MAWLPSPTRAEPLALGKLVRGALGLRPILTGWQASLGDVLAREFGDSEALKCALAANLAYYADDPKQLWWPFFAVASKATWLRVEPTSRAARASSA